MKLWFEKNIFYYRVTMQRLPPLRYKDPDLEFNRSFRSEWFAVAMRYFAHNYRKREKILDFSERYNKLKGAISMISGNTLETSTLDIIYNFLREKYIKRMRKKWKFREDFRFKISEVIPPIKERTRLTVGRIYPILNSLANENWNFQLSKYGINDEIDEEDRWIEFLPIDDLELSENLRKYRPEWAKEIEILMRTWFERNIKHKRSKLLITQKMRQAEKYKQQIQQKTRQAQSKKKLNEPSTQVKKNRHKKAGKIQHKSKKSFWFEDLFKYLQKNYPVKEKYRRQKISSEKYKNAINSVINAKIKEYQQAIERQSQIQEKN